MMAEKYFSILLFEINSENIISSINDKKEEYFKNIYSCLLNLDHIF